MKKLAFLFMTAAAFSAQANLNASPQFQKLNQLVNAADQRGLSREFYLSESVLQQLTALQRSDPAQLQSAILSKAVQVATDLSIGRVKPTQISDKAPIDDKVFNKGVEVSSYLLSQLELPQLLAALEPRSANYRQQIEILNQLKRLLTDTNVNLPAGVAFQTVKLDAADPVLLAFLRHRLNMFGYTNDLTSLVFDAELEEVLKQYQADHKLTSDGIVGSGTWRVVGKPLPQIVSQLQSNIDRLRWLPQDLPAERIWVNLATQEFVLIQNNEPTLNFRTVNGSVLRQTPLMITRMRTIVLNPTWRVPISIFVRDKLPRIKEDPGYIARMNMRLFDDLTEQEVDPLTLDWSLIDASNLHYSLEQSPGPHNALGFIKFPLVNDHAIYMHDTDSRHLFNQQNRLQSSGCVRLQRPFDLAATLLEDPQWTVETLRAFTEGQPAGSVTTPTNLRAARVVPVYLMYQTIYKTAGGKLIMAPDAYDIDTITIDLLNGRPRSIPPQVQATY